MGTLKIDAGKSPNRHAGVGSVALLLAAGLIGLCGTAWASGGGAVASDPGDPLVVHVSGGLVRGAVSDGVVAFKGIPYAAPPLGALRWEPPQPVSAWKGVRSAESYGSDCMQIPFPEDAAPERTIPNENCLYLNVWRPRKSSAHGLPVMVWIYGGGYVNGGTSPAVYDGSQFARDGVILVSFNYRLGNFGFFAFPALTAAGNGHMLGDYAFMDQLAALKWVQKNIRSFGGDPNNVTIFGESAGGSSVQNLLITPLAKGLFQKAIIESGGGRGFGPPRQLTGSATSAEAKGVELAKHFGIDGAGARALERLRALPASTLVDGLQMGTVSKHPGYVGGPIIYRDLYMGAPMTVYSANRAIGNRVPVMIGANSADIGFFPAKSVNALFAKFGPKSAAARAAFDPTGNTPLAAVSLRVGGSLMMIEPARAVARFLSSRGQPVYEYRFSYVASSVRNKSSGAFGGGLTFEQLGAMHASEIPFVFDTVKAKYNMMFTKGRHDAGHATAEDERVARDMRAYWVAFAKTGRPDPKGLPAWPRYRAGTDKLMNFTARGPIAEVDPWRARLDLAEWYSTTPHGSSSVP